MLLGCSNESPRAVDVIIVSARVIAWAKDLDGAHLSTGGHKGARLWAVAEDAYAVDLVDVDGAALIMQ